MACLPDEGAPRKGAVERAESRWSGVWTFGYVGPQKALKLTMICAQIPQRLGGEPASNTGANQNCPERLSLAGTGRGLVQLESRLREVRNSLRQLGPDKGFVNTEEAQVIYVDIMARAMPRLGSGVQDQGRTHVVEENAVAAQ